MLDVSLILHLTEHNLSLSTEVIYWVYSYEHHLEFLSVPTTVFVIINMLNHSASGISVQHGFCIYKLNYLARDEKNNFCVFFLLLLLNYTHASLALFYVKGEMK